MQVFFYIFASIAIFTSIMVILSKNTVKSVLFLILSFISTACLWLLLEAEFLAVTLVLVYIGAVMVLFLFVVMMVEQEFEIKEIGISKYSPVIICTSLFMLVILIKFIDPYIYGMDVRIPVIYEGESNVAMLGTLLYNKHSFVFIIAGFILLVGMIAAIAISFRGKQDRLNQNVSEQMKVKSNSRLRFVKIDKK